MSELQKRANLRRGAYVVKAAEGRPQRVEARKPPAGYVLPVPCERDRVIVRALLKRKGSA